ncbi:MAG: hypothetical protein ACOYD0_08505 [Candidatus Nanopelagicales bacterium]
MFLVDLAGVGGRLQHVQLNSRCGEIAAGGSVLITRLSVPAGRAIDAELGLAQSDLGGFVVGAGGQSEHGDQWIVLLQQVPDGARQAAWQIRNEALARADIEDVGDEYWVSEQLIRQYFVSSILTSRVDNCEASTSTGGRPSLSATALQGIARGLAFSRLVQLLCVELTNFPVERALANFPTGCALPNRDHHCNGDVIADIMNGWLELHGQPWMLE